MKVLVYSLPSSVCMGCKYTKRALENAGIPFETVRLDQDKDALDRIKELGYSAAPVVEVDLGEGNTTSWTGYRPTMIEQLAKSWG